LQPKRQAHSFLLSVRLARCVWEGHVQSGTRRVAQKIRGIIPFVNKTLTGGTQTRSDEKPREGPLGPSLIDERSDRSAVATNRGRGTRLPSSLPWPGVDARPICRSARWTPMSDFRRTEHWGEIRVLSLALSAPGVGGSETSRAPLFGRWSAGYVRT
jgi:hypothetical protein